MKKLAALLLFCCVASYGAYATTVSNLPTPSTGSTSLQSGDIVPATRSGVTYGLIYSGGGAGTWGSITGTLSNQTDLQNILNGKQPTITTGTTAQYLRGDLSLATFPATGVSSVFGRTGAVTAQSGDYTASQVGAEPSLGNPATNGYILSSTIGGTRSWVPAASFPLLGTADSVTAPDYSWAAQSGTGLYYNSGIGFAVSGVNAATIGANGIGIGTSASTQAISIYQPSGGVGLLMANNNPGTADIDFQPQGGGSQMYLNFSNVTSGTNNWLAYRFGASGNKWFFGDDGTNAYFQTHHPMEFYVNAATPNTSGSPALYISSSGAVSVNTATSAGAINVAGAIDISGANAISFPTSDTTAGASIAMGPGCLSGQTSSAAYANTCGGYNALHGTMTTAAVGNTAWGNGAGGSVTSGANGTYLGNGAGSNITTGNGIFVGQGVQGISASVLGEINIGGIIFANNNSTAAPTVTACGTNSIDTYANNRSGTVSITAGTPTSCTITFAGTGYGTWNHCRVTSQSVNAAFAYSYTKTVLTVTGTALAGKIDYDCDGV